MSINKDDILKAVEAQPDRLGKRELAKILGIRGDERRDLRMALKDLTEAGKLVSDDNRKYRVSGALPNVIVMDIIRIDDQGDMIGMPAGARGGEDAPEFIVREPSQRGSKGGGHRSAKLGVGSKALCRINQKTMSASVIKALSRQAKRELGVVMANPRGFIIKPVSKRARDEYLPAKGTQGLTDQDLVLFEPLSGRRQGFRGAKIIENLGTMTDGKSASIISLHEHNIPIGFDDEVIAEAQNLALPTLGGPREDLRELPLITIDPDDAKDFDDAIYARRADDGKGWIVWVAIADVSAFVTAGSLLDKAAHRRGNSVYLPDRVEPMLPHALSSDLCSLRPHEERACLAVRMSFDESGHKTGHKFHRGIMKSHARLTYTQAQQAFDGEPGEAAAPVKDILADVYAAYEALSSAKAARAPLAIEMPERRVRIGESGQVIAIEVKERFDAHKLVEECMIQANVAAAEALEAKKADLVYRVHEPPQRERLQGLADFLPAVKLKWALGERATTSRFNKLLASAASRDLSEVVGMAVLRTQSQAIYTPENKGHFGLNLTHYAHFTSPIRRYSDLVVHRALIKAFNLGDDGITKKQVSQLKETAEHISDTERRAMAAERDAKDRYIAAFLSDRIGAKFAARINGVTKFGLFITLEETGADGLVPMRALGHERFKFDERARCLIGYDTGGTYKFGARCTVKLMEATPVSGGLVFEMVSKPEPGKKPSGGRGAGYRKHKRKSGRRR